MVTSNRFVISIKSNNGTVTVTKKVTGRNFIDVFKGGGGGGVKAMTSTPNVVAGAEDGY